MDIGSTSIVRGRPDLDEKRRRLFPGTELEILVPSRTSVLGFLAGLLVAILNIGFVFWLLRR